MSEDKPSKNPFINAAKKAAANPKVPGHKAQQVQQVKYHSQISGNKPQHRAAGRGR